MKILNDIGKMPATTIQHKYDMKFGSHIIPDVAGYVIDRGEVFIPENLSAMQVVLSWCYKHQTETNQLFERYGLKQIDPTIDDIVMGDMMGSKYLDLTYHILSMCEIKRTGSI